MNDDLRALYQEVILDHYKRPRNFGVLEGANRQAQGTNPLCGDQVTVFARIEDDALAGVSFQGHGCAISTASASLMTEAVQGLPLGVVRDTIRRFHSQVTGEEVTGAEISGEGGNEKQAVAADFGPADSGGGEDSHAEAVAKLEVLHGVRAYPVRIKCATLPWHALKAAIDGTGEPVTTE